uniref:N-lysine methyltransferase SETD6 n=1 Tax=Myxine glutinosa TaxID=7769 RepID=UPI00358E2559
MTSETPEARLKRFLTWCEKVHLKMNPKVRLSMHGVAAGYGMLAVKPIASGEVLFVVPRSAVLSHSNTDIHQLLTAESPSLRSRSRWVPLLITLMYESSHLDSPWAPYIALWPNFLQADLPMFWPRDERRELLRGTGVLQATAQDLRNIRKEFRTVVAHFPSRHTDVFEPERSNLELYTRLVAFVMAYSFQESRGGKKRNPPMMVPMADMLNHTTNHNAQLEFSQDVLKMVAVRAIADGEEVFNTYGQLANSQLLHMYGFTEPGSTNSNDTARVPWVSLLRSALHGQGPKERNLLRRKWRLLSQLTALDKEGILVGWDGVHSAGELEQVLKVLSMPKGQFGVYCKHQCWKKEVLKDYDTSLSNDAILNLPKASRDLLLSGIQKTLATLAIFPQECKMQGKNVATHTERWQQVLMLRQGQSKILENLLELKESSTE